jgi:putative ABC transport system permease protein
MISFDTLQNTSAIALHAVLLNKKRSFLTMLGVIIGVGSVVLLTSIGTGLQSYVADQFAGLGTNTLYVVPGNPFSGGGGSESALLERTKAVLKYKTFEKVLRSNRDIFDEGVATNLGRAEAKQGNVTKKVTLFGVTAGYATVQNTKAEKGEWFTQTDDDRKKRVVLLGPKIAEELFGQVDPVNKKVKLEGQSYIVKGVLEKKGGGFGGPSLDNYVYMPFHTLESDFNILVINNFVFSVRDRSQIAEAKKVLETELNKDLKKDDYTVFDQTQLLTTINSILGVLTAGLGGISAISLVVGGIGIMNIMLVSVTERTREIGLRKALGATPNLILLQFLIEAALLSVLGGMIGVGIAFLGTAAIQSVFPAKILPEAILLAFGVSMGVGLVFGAAPARQASKLSPIEALRSE